MMPALASQHVITYKGGWPPLHWTCPSWTRTPLKNNHAAQETGSKETWSPLQHVCHASGGAAKAPTGRTRPKRPACMATDVPHLLSLRSGSFWLMSEHRPSIARARE